jgi:hypothetical protein
MTGDETSMKGPNRASLYAGIALGAAILIGVAAGFVLGRRSETSRNRSQMKQSAFEMTMLGISRGWLLDSLGLSPAQRLEVDSLLTATRLYAESAVERMITDVKQRTDETRDRVRSLLSEPQKNRFDSLLNTAPPVRMRTPVPPQTP